MIVRRSLGSCLHTSSLPRHVVGQLETRLWRAAPASSMYPTNSASPFAGIREFQLPRITESCHFCMSLPLWYPQWTTEYWLQTPHPWPFDGWLTQAV